MQTKTSSRRLLAAAALGAPLLAQSEPVPSPEEFLGHPLGARFTPHHRIAAYAELLASRSPRLRLERYGETKGGRPLLLLLVTSEANHARAEALRTARVSLGDPRTHEAGAAAELARDQPALVWLSYNVHGNEASPGEAALRVLHRLATASDPETLSWLDALIVAVDPCVNPDGRDRYVHWYQDAIGAAPDAERQSLEHEEPWPGGRGNGELFDLNRDWAFATQAETRARLARFVPLAPQVHVDFHEMGLENGYFFFPAEKPINANLGEHTLRWAEVFGRGNAAAFDARGWLWYSAEDFDLFYPGYGDSWPSFGGAIGMTYEQGGGSSAGSIVRRRDDSLLSLAQRLDAHAVATYATLETAAQHRAELLVSWAAFRRSAFEEGSQGPLRAFAIPEAPDPGRAAELATLLRLQGIEVERLDAEWIPEKAASLAGRDVLFPHFPRGTYVVRLAQPLKRLAKTLLETEVKLDEVRFYDVSAWCLPLAFGLECYSCESAPPLAREELPAYAKSGGVAPGEATVGWLLSYAPHDALRALCAALEAGVRVRCAAKPFTLEQREWPRGTLLVRRSENHPEIESRLREIGALSGVQFEPVRSGFTEKGIDLGSGSMRALQAPRIALLGGRGTFSTSFGSARFVLERGLGLRVSALPLSEIATLDLEDFTAIVVPEARLRPEATEKLRAFARAGGTVVALGRAAHAFAGEKDGLRLTPEVAPPPPGEAPRWTEAREKAEREREQPGSIFSVELDPAHPIAFGATGGIATLHVGDRAFDAQGPGLHVGLFARESPLSGYVPTASAQALRGAAFVTVEQLGKGRLVLFAADPSFRGVWHGLTRILANAILLLPEAR